MFAYNQGIVTVRGVEASMQDIIIQLADRLGNEEAMKYLPVFQSLATGTGDYVFSMDDKGMYSALRKDREPLGVQDDGYYLKVTKEDEDFAIQGKLNTLYLYSEDSQYLSSCIKIKGYTTDKGEGIQTENALPDGTLYLDIETKGTELAKGGYIKTDKNTAVAITVEEMWKGTKLKGTVDLSGCQVVFIDTPMKVLDNLDSYNSFFQGCTPYYLLEDVQDYSECIEDILYAMDEGFRVCIDMPMLKTFMDCNKWLGGEVHNGVIYVVDSEGTALEEFHKTAYCEGKAIYHIDFDGSLREVLPSGHVVYGIRISAIK